MAEEFRLVTDDVSSSLWELVDKELAGETNKGQITISLINVKPTL